MEKRIKITMTALTICILIICVLTIILYHIGIIETSEAFGILIIITIFLINGVCLVLLKK